MFPNICWTVTVSKQCEIPWFIRSRNCGSLGWIVFRQFINVAFSWVIRVSFVMYEILELFPWARPHSRAVEFLICSDCLSLREWQEILRFWVFCCWWTDGKNCESLRRGLLYAARRVQNDYKVRFSVGLAAKYQRSIWRNFANSNLWLHHLW